METRINTDLLIKLRNNVNLFKDIDLLDIQWLLNRGEKLVLHKDSVVFKEDSPSDYFYINLRGNLIAYKQSPGIITNVLNLNEIPDLSIFGEIGILLNINRTASIKCKTDCVVVRYTNQIFELIEKANPKLAILLYKNLISIMFNNYVLPRQEALNAKFPA